MKERWTIWNSLLLTRAQEKGLRRLIATHVEWPPVRASLEMQKRYVDCGAFLEHCVINILAGSLSVEELAAQIREIGAAAHHQPLPGSFLKRTFIFPVLSLISITA